MQEALRKLRDKCEEYQLKLNPNYLQHLVNHLMGTFFKHYRLYQFVLCEDREIDQTIYDLVVQIPHEAPSLKGGVSAELWKYQKQITELSEAEDQLRASMAALRETMQLKSEQKLEKFYEDLKFQDKEVIERANLEKIIKDAHEIQMSVASELLQKVIETAFQILDLKIQKTTISLPATKSPATKETKTGRMGKKK
ncbi:uncharacterized protein C8orf74 homolog isoform X3 [Scyliorhinus torazame]